MIANHESQVFRLQAADFEIFRIKGVELLPLACIMVAHLEFIATWDCSAHICVILVVVSRVVFPDTSLNVANAVLLGLWLLAAGPKIGFIEPLVLNPVAIEANRVVELLRDGFGPAFGIVEAILRAFEHALLDITVMVVAFAVVLFVVIVT